MGEAIVEQASLEGMEGVPDALTEAQVRSEEARRIFEGCVGDEYQAVDMTEYWRLVGAGWRWRQAVFILWSAMPRDQRTPKTQAELATEVLGLASDRVIREWKGNPALDAEVAKVASGALMRHRPEIYRALVEAASNPSPRANSDRRLALEMLGDYQPKQRLAVGPDLPDDLSELDAGELRMLASLPGAEDGAGGSGSGTAGAGA